MIPFIGYLTKPVVLVLAGVVLTVGAIAGLYAWSNDRCEDTLREAMSEAETTARAERDQITQDWIEERESYETHIRWLQSQVSTATNDTGGFFLSFAAFKPSQDDGQSGCHQ